MQAPAWQVSAPLQALPSVHDVPFAAKPFAGQAADDPEHVSATSQAPAAPRQTVAAFANWHAAGAARAAVAGLARVDLAVAARRGRRVTVMVTACEAVPSSWSVTVSVA